MRLRHAESIVARLQAAQADLHALQVGEAGRLRVGTFQSVGARVLPEIMRRFGAQWPAIDVVGLEPKFTFRSNDNGTVQGLVAAGVANAIMPRLTVDQSDPRVAVLELGAALPPRVIAIGRHRDRYLS